MSDFRGTGVVWTGTAGSSDDINSALAEFDVDVIDSGEALHIVSSSHTIEMFGWGGGGDNPYMVAVGDEVVVHDHCFAILRALP
tara:strand:- start:1729 stop:1980 length:252 start_codon:yes stop_codon:yes gene_type:complete